MAKKTKSKARLDKFYRIAKEQGLRSRAAFKLIQLNQRHHFLEKASVLVDLCAAPGGWLQVAARHMPAASLIVGVDLDPIKAVPGAITFQGDITSDDCWQQLKRELRHLKADVVLNDGAPNVGSDWNKDAYTQSELCLAALRLATRLLRPGGLFITKVFRSTDYANLLRVFRRIFTSVEANKPAASRSISAEIFVVCNGFCGAEQVEADWLNPKIVFAQTERDANDAAQKVDSLRKIFAPSKHRAIADDAPSTMFSRLPLADFISSPNPFAVFTAHNSFAFEDAELSELSRLAPPPEDFREMAADLRLLGPAQVRTLLRWRQRVLLARARERPPRPRTPPTEVAAPSDVRPRDEAVEEQRRERRAARAVKAQPTMAPIAEDAELAAFRFGDFPRTFNQGAFVDLEALNANAVTQNRERLDRRPRAKVLAQMEEEVELLYEEKQKRAEQTRQSREKAVSEPRKEKKNALNMRVEDVKKLRKDSSWFDRPIFQPLEQNTQTAVARLPTEPAIDAATSSEDEPNQKALPEEFDSRALENGASGRAPIDEEEMAELRALSRKMLRKKTRREILDQAYNRYNYPEDPATLPRWFVEDERRAVGKIPQVTKEDVQREREQLRVLRSRLPMKVIEAKYRRKKRLLGKLERAKSSAQEVLDNDTLTPLLKGKELNKIYGKALAAAKSPRKKVVVSRGFSAKAPRAKQGRKYKAVDRRLKKDLRANKKVQKKRR